MISIRTSDTAFTSEAFVSLAQQVWPQDYDVARISSALQRSHNIGAWDGDRLIGAVRILSDGYLFACVAEILVEPAYQRQGVGRQLMDAALSIAPRGKLFLGARPQSVAFFERLGYEKGPVGFVASGRAP